MLLISGDGTILSSKLPERASTRLIEQIEWIQYSMRYVYQELRREKLKKVTYELDDARIIFTKVGTDMVLVHIGGPQSDLSVMEYNSGVMHI